MIDADVIKRLVEAEITKTVQEQVDAVLSEAEWLESLEQKILMQTQNRMLSKFSSADAMPEILEAVKISVKKLFDEGHVPGVMDFVDPALIKPVVDQAVEIKINQSRILRQITLKSLLFHWWCWSIIVQLLLQKLLQDLYRI